MDIIEQIGSYAGLAAIVGLAVLSALYFSQARDVRRLRESREGPAPPRAAQPVEAPGPKRPTAAKVPPATAAAAAAKAAPDQRAPEPPPRVRPLPTVKEGGAQEEKDKPAAPAAHGAAAAAAAAPAAQGPPAPPAAASTGNSQAPPQTTPAAPGARAGNAGPPPPRPPSPRLPPPRPGAPAAALRTSGATVTGTGLPWYRRLAPRYIALLVAGVVVVSAGAVFAITALVEQGDDSTGIEAPAGSEQTGAAAPLDPSTITVAVLNGTDLAGLAAQVADTVEAAGFQRGNVANATEQASAESAVLYADGARRAARQVGQELRIGQIEPVDEQSAALAGTADVVVIVGADQAE